jgi:hypothetical protein
VNVLKHSSNNDVNHIYVCGDNNHITIENGKSEKSSFSKKLAAVAKFISCLIISLAIAAGIFCRLLTVSDGVFLSLLEDMLESYSSSIVIEYR